MAHLYKRSQKKLGVGIVLGAALGIVFAFSLDNWFIGIILGLVFATVFEKSYRKNIK